MRRQLVQGLIIGILFTSAAVAQSQSSDSLGEIARANRSKEQAGGTKPKTITNQDLHADGPSDAEENASDPMTQVSGVKRSNRAADQRLSNRLAAEQRAVKEWRARIQEQEAKVADIQARIDHINALRQASVGTAQYDKPVNRDEAIRIERVERLQEELNQQKRRLASMQDEARRAGLDQ